MRKPVAALACLTLAGSLSLAATTGPAVAAPTGPAPKPKAGVSLGSDVLTKAVTVRGILQHERRLQSIANANDGNRASGQPGFDASADYVAATMRASGYRVTRQPFTFPSFTELEPATLTQTAPTEREVETAVMEYSGSGDVTGELVPIDLVLPPTAEPSSTSGCEASDFPAAPADDAVALIQRGTCDFSTKVTNAEEAGYDAVVIFNEGQEGRQELLQGTLGAPVDIPVVGTSFEDGQALADEATEVNVFTSTDGDPAAETENVIVDVPGKTKRPGQVVVVGAHLDSVDAGPGINDNGSGTSTLLEIAQQMAAKKLTSKLNRPVRFIFFGAEEAGLLGSEAYVASLRPAQQDKIYANLNFDMLGSPNYVRFVYDGDGSDSTAGPVGSAGIEQIFTRYFKVKGLASAPTAFDGRSDYGPFIAQGIPAGGLFSGAEGIKTAEEAATYGGTADEAYDSCYHQACDDINNLSGKALNELGDAAAHATYVLTATGKGIYPDGSRQATRTPAPRAQAGDAARR